VPVRYSSPHGLYDLSPLPGINESRQVTYIRRRDDHLIALLREQRRLRRQNNVAVQRLIVGRWLTQLADRAQNSAALSIVSVVIGM